MSEISNVILKPNVNEPMSMPKSDALFCLCSWPKLHEVRLAMESYDACSLRDPWFHDVVKGKCRPAMPFKAFYPRVGPKL